MKKKNHLYWQQSSLSSMFMLLVLSLFLCGAVGTVAGFFGFFYPLISGVLLLPISVLMFIAIKNFTLLSSLKFSEKIITLLLSSAFLMHSVQIFVPETAFDAVWYHLPVAHHVVQHHHFYIDLNLYQSFNPLFTDSIFYMGFAILKEQGAKAVGYLFALCVVLSTYMISRTLLPKKWSLLLAFLVSTFQVITWQAASFYIDVAKAFWEISALYLLLHSKNNFNLAISSISLGASLASKLFSLALIPLFLLILVIQKRKVLSVLLFLSCSIAVAFPYYYLAYIATGNPFYSFTHHIGKISDIGGSPSITGYLIRRIQKIPHILYELLLTKEYTSPLVIVCFPLILMYRSSIMKNKSIFILVLFSIYQLALWWFLPPQSTRYALSGFITATVVSLYFLIKLCIAKKFPLNTLYLICTISGILALSIRVPVLYRSSQYIFGHQSKQEYIQQFLDGSIDDHLLKWHEETSSN